MTDQETLVAVYVGAEFWHCRRLMRVARRLDNDPNQPWICDFVNIKGHCITLNEGTILTEMNKGAKQ